jgi:hypothetical protein
MPMTSTNAYDKSRAESGEKLSLNYVGLDLPGCGDSPPHSHTANRLETVGGYFPQGPWPSHIQWDLGLTPQSARKLLFL